MRLTTKGRFAVTAMLDIAMREHMGPIALSAISQRQQISLSYLEQLFGKLRRKGLVESTRGPGGGYSLARPSKEINITEIILSVDEPLDATNCSGKQDCMGNGPCMTHDLWTELNRRIVNYLDSVTLQHMVQEQVKNGYELEDDRPFKSPISPMTVVKPIKITTPNSVFALGSTAPAASKQETA